MPSRLVAEQAAEAGTPSPEQGSRPLDVSDRATQFQVIPQVCLIEDVCRILRLSQSQFFRLMARRDLALVEMKKLDRHRRFTGESVARVIRMKAS